MIFVYLAIFLPLISALISAPFAMSKPCKLIHLTSSALLSIAALSAFIVFKYSVIDKNIFQIILSDFINIYNFETKFTIKIDALSASMLVLVNFVSACVHIYSMCYMEDDPKINRFFTYLGMFTFFMIILIVSDDLLQLFLGWEGVGLSSYLLISFWFKKESASKAANKAFIVNRIGDFGLILAIGLCYFVFHTINFTELSLIIPQHINHTINLLGYNISSINLICLLMFLGCMGKSAQFGLHIWLPDAMEGPTPVSALIHAATMVTAGVFLLARCFYLFEASDIKYIILFVGGVTSVFAAAVAIFQNDIKKIIAYSTCSQLGYMFMACAAGGYNAGIFHLLTHGFFKALLFLSAGSIIHSTHEQDLNKLPNDLFKNMPYTLILMCIGTLAITGIPPFAGFYSKDAIIEYIMQAPNGMSQKFAYCSAMLTVILTSYYSWKLIFKSFFNKNNINKSSINPHESGLKILLPMILLSFFAFGSGIIMQKYLGIISGDTKIYWGQSLQSEQLNHHNANFLIQNLPLIFAIFGASIAYYIHIMKKNSMDNNNQQKTNGIFCTAMINKLYIDEIYQKIIIKPTICLAKILAFFDQSILDKYGVNFWRESCYNLSEKFSKFHNGILYRYSLWQITTLVLILIYFLLIFK